MPEPILVFLQQATKERNDSETKCSQYVCRSTAVCPLKYATGKDYL